MSILNNILKTFIGDKTKKDLKNITPLVTEIKSFENQPIPYGANILHFGGGQKEAELSLPPGKYSLQLAIGDYEHKPINRNRSDQKYDPILSEIINVEILP